MNWECKLLIQSKQTQTVQPTFYDDDGLWWLVMKIMGTLITQH